MPPEFQNDLQLTQCTKESSVTAPGRSKLLESSASVVMSTESLLNPDSDAVAQGPRFCTSTSSQGMLMGRWEAHREGKVLD